LLLYVLKLVIPTSVTRVQPVTVLEQCIIINLPSTTTCGADLFSALDETNKCHMKFKNSLHIMTVRSENWSICVKAVDIFTAQCLSNAYA